jgi:guanylate kinase
VSAKPLVIVLHGPSGVGKDTVIAELRRRTGIHRATSSTSRRPRPGECDGVDYHFLSEAEFERKIAAGDFAEWARVYGDLKGLERSEIETPLKESRDVIIRTDVQGARTWRERLEGAIFVCLVAEDGSALRQRLEARGSEDDASLRRRLAELDEELRDLHENDYVVTNHEGRLDQTVAEIEAIIDRERLSPSRPAPRLKR